MHLNNHINNGDFKVLFRFHIVLSHINWKCILKNISYTITSTNISQLFVTLSYFYLRPMFFNKTRVYHINDNNLDKLSIFDSMTTSLLHSQLKRLHFLSLLIRRSVYQTQAFMLSILNTFVHNYHFNLVVMFVCLLLFLQ